MAKRKYSLETRLAVVNHYLAGRDGTERTAQLFGVERTSVRRWVSAYRYHGVAGLISQDTGHNAEFRLVVVRAVLDEKLSMREAAARFNIPNEMAVRHWLDTVKASGPQGLLESARAQDKKMAKKNIPRPPEGSDPETWSVEQFRAELRYLRAENAYLKKLKALDLREKTGRKPE